MFVVFGIVKRIKSDFFPLCVVVLIFLIGDQVMATDNSVVVNWDYIGEYGHQEAILK